MDKLNINTENGLHIRSMQDYDWPFVRSIYIEGISTNNATFEINAPTNWEDWNNRYLPTCRLVATYNQEVVGWVMLTKVSPRECYAGLAEISIYIEKKSRGKGIGFKLLSNLINNSEKNGFWTLQAGIFPENSASLSLFQKCGFREVGVREKIANLSGKWRDMILLERRSTSFLS